MKTPAFLCALVASLALLSNLNAQQTVGDILQDPAINWLMPQQRAQAAQQMKVIEVRELLKARQLAEARGIPFRRELPNGRVVEVAGIDERGELIFITTHNANAAISTGVNLLRPSPYNLDGAGLIVGVWDGGSALSTHQEFNEGASSRINVMDGAAANYHATHVAGTIAAFGVVANAKGMAPAATVDSYYWNSDESEITSRAATASGQFGTHVYLSNHSYGYSYGWDNGSGTWTWTGTGTDQNAYDIDFGQYSTKSRNLDTIAYNAPYYLAYYSAGNENNDGPGNGGTCIIGGVTTTYNASIHPQNDGDYRNGFETVGDHGVAKNVLTIGAANDAVSGGVRNPSSGTIASFSSTGPCDDGRIKPDIVANGVSLYSTDSGNNTAYRNLNGTSMSSPNACGSTALVVERYRELFGADAAMRASTLKGLIIHTATDVGIAGPDYTYGWGYMNAKAANDLLTDAATYPDMLCIEEGQLSTSTPTQTYTFFWDGASPIKATLCWTDPSGLAESTHDNRTPDLVNNLNVKLIAPDNTEHFPFVMPFVGTWTVASMSQAATTGVNNTDNVEQVLIAAPGQTGEWTIEVSHTGGLTNNVQQYGLLVSGSYTNPSGTLSFNSDSFSVDENAGTATITVDRIGGNSGAVSVDYATSNGSAIAGSDYTATSGTLSWADGDSDSKTFTVAITNDSTHEDPQETLSLTLSNPNGATISSPNPATLSINEDDNQLPSVNAGSNQLVTLSGSVWSPSTLSPAVWLDADDATTLTLNGSTVSQWNDKSGNNRHATQGAAGSQPTLTSGGLNGRNVLTFDGSSDYLNLDLDFMAGVDHSVFVVTKTSATGYTDIYGAANGSAGANSLHVGFISSNNYRMNYWSNDWNGSISANFQAGSANLLNYIWLSGATKEIFANGQSEGTNISAGVVGTMSGGGRISNVVGHGYYGGDIAEFIAFGNSLTPTQRQEMEGFLAHKWGTTSLLDAGHPYKSQSPNNYSATTNLAGTASDGDGDSFTVTWSVLPGSPGSVTFGDENALNTTADFSAAGVYTLRLTADDGYGTSSSDVVITVLEEGTSTYTVNFQTDGTASASLTGTTSQIVVEGGETSAVTANAPAGHHFVNWTAGGSLYSTDNPLTATNVTTNLTLTANFAKDASIAITDDGLISEQAEDGEAILVTLTDATFADPLTPANWTLSGQPGGVGRGSVTRINDTTARILLSGNSTTDYDSNITGMTVSCSAAEVSDAVAPVSANSGVTFTAFNDAESIEIADDGWILEGAEDGELITVILNGGTFVNSLNGGHFTVSNLPTGVSPGTVTRVNANVATIQLSGNRTGTYGGNDITDVTVTCLIEGYTDSTGGSSLNDSSGVTLRALSGGSATIDFQDGVNSYDGATDTYIYAGAPSSNYGTASTIRLNNRIGGGPNETLLRGLLRFDLSSLPTNTTILSAELNFVQDNTIAALVDIVEATSSWGEGTATWNNANTFFGGTSFGSANTSTTAGAAVPTITLNTAGLNKLQSWVTDPSSNHGFGILTTLAETGEASSMALRSGDYTADTSHRPKLSITYQITGGTSAPEINLQGNGLSIVSGDTTPASADHTDFGSCFTGGPTVVRTFTIQNVGDAALTLDGSPLVDITGTHAGDFAVTSLPSSGITAGTSTTFALTFTPGAAGNRTATVSIASDDADEALYTFAVQGEGITPPVTYSVTYNGNGNTGGSVPVDALSPYESGATVMVLGNSSGLVWDGHTFNGWNTASNGSGTPRAPATNFTINSNTTLFAQWTANTPGFTLSKSTATVAEAGGTDTFTVVLDSQPAADVVFDVSSSNTGEATVSPASLTFTPQDWDSPQTVTLTGVNDSSTTTDAATVTVSVNDGSSADAYDALADQTVAVTCTNDDIPGFTMGAISGNTSESGTTATFTVALSTQPTANVTIDLSSSDTGEGTIDKATLTFTDADWSTAQTVTVTGVDDALDDGNQAFTIVTAAASSSDGDYNGINPDDVSVTNLDDDTAAFTLSAISNPTDENGTTATFTVVLDSQPTADVTIGISSSDTGEGTVDKASLTFTNSDWNVAQTVTVTGVDDALDDGDQAFTIVTAAASSSDGNYGGENPADVSVTNLDDDFTLTVVTGSGGESTSGGGIVDADLGPYAISATPANGYSFTNWTLTAGSATFGDANSATTTVSASADASIEANFEANTYTVTFDGNGGSSPVPTTVEVTFDAAYGTLATTDRSGYAFTGWFTQASGGTEVDSTTTVATSADHTLYAQWVNTLTWDANATTAAQTDGGGVWLDPDQWWNGNSNQTWFAGSNAQFGNGGNGGTVTVGTVGAGSVLLDNFSGTYTLQNGTLTQSGGLTLGPNADQVTFGSGMTLAGDGGLAINGGVLRCNAATLSYLGDTSVTGGGILLSFNNLPSGNVTLNNGAISDYYRSATQFTGGLGIGDNQIQIHGDSGFGGGNGNSNFRIGAQNSVLTWGSTHFNPTTLKLRTAVDNNGPSIYGQVTLQNRIDLNGATRTIEVFRSGADAMISWGKIDGGLQDTGATGNLVKTGGGMLALGGSSSTWGGSTTISEGIVDFGATNIANIGGGSGRNLSMASGTVLRFNTLSNAVINRIVETSDEITVMTGSTANSLDFSSTGANLPGAFLANYISNNGKTEYSGTLTPSGDTFRLGSPYARGVLGIVGSQSDGTNPHSLLINDRGAGAVILTAANTFSGDTVMRSDARLILGNNLALQNSAVDTDNGNLYLSTGAAAGKVTGDTLADSPTLGGLTGSTNLTTFIGSGSAGVNNTAALTHAAILGFTLNPGSGKTCSYSGDLAEFAIGTTLTKTGAGTQILTGAGSYTGITTLNAGKLLIDGSLSNLDVALTVASGATLGGVGSIGRNVTVADGGRLEFDISSNPAGHDALDIGSGRSFDFTAASELTITSSGGATVGTYTLITGGNNLTGIAPATVNLPNGWTGNVSISGNSLVLEVTAISTAYASWASGFSPNLTNSSASVDFDGGGYQTGMEYVLGGDPTNINDDAGLHPLHDNSDPDFFIYTYRRSDVAMADPNTTITVEYGSTLGDWADANHNGSTIIVSATNDAAGPGIDLVEVKIHRSLVSADKVFTRLRVELTTP